MIKMNIYHIWRSGININDRVETPNALQWLHLRALLYPGTILCPTFGLTPVVSFYVFFIIQFDTEFLG